MGKSLLQYTASFIAFTIHLFNNDRIHCVCSQDFYTYEPGDVEDATIVAHNRCRKLVKDMHYESQVQCIINYCATVLHRRIKKEEARTMKLTQEQYLQVHLDKMSNLVYRLISFSYM